MPPLDLYACVRFCFCNLRARPRVRRVPGFPCAPHFLGDERQITSGAQRRGRISCVYILRHSGMVRRTRPGISRFRVRCCASPRNDRTGSLKGKSDRAASREAYSFSCPAGARVWRCWSRSFPRHFPLSPGLPEAAAIDRGRGVLDACMRGYDGW